MNRDEFYSIIDNARGQVPASADPEALRSVLEELDDDELWSFGLIYNAELVRLNRWALWDAGYVAAGGMSDDAFHYFRSWLIGKGVEVVETAIDSPDALVDVLDVDELDNELLEYVVLELLEQRGIEDDPRDATDDSADDPPTGDQVEDAESLAELYPRLAEWASRR